MGEKSTKWRLLLMLVVSGVMILTALPSPLLASGAGSIPEGYNSLSYADMTPINKVTLINHDREGYLDDFAYLAEVPASVFHHGPSERVFMYPLLFYEPPVETDDPGRVHNTYPGVSYFMEDMVTISDGELDLIELVGFGGSSPGDVGGDWRASEVVHIDGDSPYELSASIALENWEYADTAVLAVIDDSPEPFEKEFTGSVTGTTPDARPTSDSMTGEKQPSPVDPNIHGFSVGTDYKYITSQLTWGKSWNPLSDITERGKDPDLQLYDLQLGMVGASEKWNVLEGASEEISSYIYHAGDWEFAVTYMPTESSLDRMSDPVGWGSLPDPMDVTPRERDEWQEERIERVRADRTARGLSPDAPFDSTVEYTIDYTLYPGVDIPRTVETPFYCRDATFTLKWEDSGQALGLILKGPSGAEIAVATAATGGATQVLEIPQLGQGDYSLSVINLGDNAKATDFKVEYSFRQMKEEDEALSWASGVNGAVLASELNAPLLFTPEGGMKKAVGNALNTLGVKEVYLVDIGGRASGKVLEDIDGLRGFLQSEIDVTHIDNFDGIYSRIQEESFGEGENNQDIVFTTMDPWTAWDVLQGRDTTINPKEEYPGALFIGPAALAGAVHGAPVFINDIHPELSCAQAWHNRFWVYAYHHGRAAPSVACMVLTGRSIYRTLDRYGLDRKTPVDEYGKCKESILTVAGQFDIGSSWDRTLVGAADSGRIMGTPVDTSVWISRSALYPKVVYANPAVDPSLDEHDGMRIQGSESTRIGGKLVVTKEAREEKVDFPVANTWVSYQYKFNEQASYYWGCPYTTKTGITPWFDHSSSEDDPDGIDPDGRYPDLDSSEVVPHYLEASGYGNAFTTTFEATTENLNRGAIMWLEVMHGGHTYSGVVGWWDERRAEEGNPWRGYEESGVPLAGTQFLRMRGATDDPDVVTMSKHVGLDVTPGFGPQTGVGIVPEHHDGVIIAISQQGQTEYSENGLVMDDAFENLHSLGFSAGSCLIANTYLHLMLVRHGSVFQVIDPWLTSWYSAFAMNMFCRDVYYGRTIGDAYERGISHVGIEYLVEDGFWWDIFENLVYYGDPDLKVFSPKNAWAEPESLERGTVLGGHAPFGADGHPHAMGTGLLMDILFFSALIGLVGAGVYIYYRWKKGLPIPLVGKWIGPGGSTKQD